MRSGASFSSGIMDGDARDAVRCVDGRDAADSRLADDLGARVLRWIKTGVDVALLAWLAWVFLTTLVARDSRVADNLRPRRFA